jgi:diguanylate cyclase (GGDEF)-like protein
LKDRVQSCQLEIPGREETSISLEIGIASYPAQARTVESLLKAADDNLYLVKEGGNSCQE